MALPVTRKNAVIPKKQIDFKRLISDIFSCVSFLSRLSKVIHISAKPGSPPHVTIRDDVMISTQNIDLAASGNIYIDTFGGKIGFNGRMARQIRDLPESIEYRKKSEMLARKRLRAGLILAKGGHEDEPEIAEAKKEVEGCNNPATAKINT